MTLTTKLMTATAIIAATSVSAEDLEVMHWWTSGGEAAAVGELAKAFDATGNTWVDAAIAGGDAARAVMVSRLTGGDPMGAFQFNHGRQAEELIEAGLLRDITDIAEAEGWKDIVNPPSLLESCTVDGRIYCAPVNIHSWQWLWLSHKAYEDAGLDVPTNWDEFVASSASLNAAGKLPLALGQQGWQQRGMFNVLFAALVPNDVFLAVYDEKDADVAAGADVSRVFAAAADARDMAVKSTVQNWNDATNLVITGQAGGQIMGDWAQGEFAVAGQVAGTDYSCLPGLGVTEVLSTGGDAFYFPVMKDDTKTAAQSELAALMLRPATQVSFNLAKGSLPVRGDIDMSTANDCMQKGLGLLANGAILPDTAQLVTPDTAEQISTLFIEFFADTSITVEDAQAQFVKIIATAE
ncbi:ABC transporter substrate-binding protein [Pelagimonas varians]|uniref:Probable sugar-binding periplasmic protein n=1 Tax=Pelagimonas varians TaxID=696760 RepID=A0A238KWH3_9RHOB|nr:ABC transporter substrate-binding protein [Pelagimonas varians]PYG27982.1 carbohydrate ABC transporter substrate-binding protein (CUT1 family) [Pelagimonas varians]SMX47145.1 putative sugar-binding periplasmic protein precursor [Pelagimonas varians]